MVLCPVCETEILPTDDSITTELYHSLEDEFSYASLHKRKKLHASCYNYAVLHAQERLSKEERIRNARLLLNEERERG